MKYWKALVAATLALALSACGGGDGNDKNEPPPPRPGAPDSLTISASQPILNESGQLKVQFKVTDKRGSGYDLGSTIPSFTLNKVMPGRKAEREDPTIWKSFIYRAGKATSENTGTLEALGNGEYLYTFATNPTSVQDPYPADSQNNNGLISWDETATHRLGILFGGINGLPVTSYVLDWVPAGTRAALTRDIVDQSSCNSCHMKQPIKHPDRGADPKLCVTCHNESNPDKAERRSLTTIVHNVHRGLNLDLTGTAKVSHFPQDPRNCDTCHKDATPATLNAANWQHAQEKACGACHADSNSALGFDAHITGKINSGALCTQCHGSDPTSSKSPYAVHLGYMANEAIGRDKLKFTFDEVRYAAPNIEVELTVTIDGAPAEDVNDVLQYVKDGNPTILVNWDQGQGFELATTNPQTFASSNKIEFRSCVSQGAGRFLCSKDTGNEVNGTLAATIADLRVCVARKAARNNAYAAGALLPCDNKASSVIAINPVNAYFHVGGGIDNRYQLKAGADLASCNSCHKDLAVHMSNHAAKDMSQCTSCHNATRTSFYAGVPGDLKYHVHSFHALGAKHAGASTFPGKVNNCESCHTQGQYNLPNQQNARPSLVATTADNTQPKYFSPMLVVCSSCHLTSPLGLVKPDSPAKGDEWAGHMKSNGAVFGAETIEAATGVEQCASCHAVGHAQGVDKVHKVYDFR